MTYYTIKTLLEKLELSDNLKANSIFGQRPEQLSVSQFIELTTLIQNDK